MSFAIAKGSLIGSGGGGGGGGIVEQGPSGSDPWGIKVEHPIEDDGGADYVRIKDKYSDDNNTYLARIPISPATDTKLEEINVSIGATTDDETALTVIGRIKNLLSRIPAALIDGRFDINIGSWFGSTVPAIGQKTAINSIPVVVASDNGLATAIKQPTIGTAGSPSVDVISVQGVVSGTSIPSSNSISSQVDGHSATIGATTDADTTNTVVGRLKKIISTLTDGSQKSIVRGGAKGSTTATDVTSTAGGSNHQLLDVAIYNSAGTMISAGDATAMYVQGPGNAGAALLGRPNVIAISDGGNAQIPLGDSSGRQRVIIVRNLATNGTTDAATRFPTLGDFTASSSGVAVVKATGGRLFAFDVYYTGSTASGIWLHAHDAANATTPVTGTIKKSWPINNGTNVQIEWDSIMDLCFTNGIKFTISSTRLTETTATTETFSIAAWGA